MIARTIFAAAMTVMSAGASHAADFRVMTPPGYDHTMVFVSGEISEGDANRFYGATSEIGRATVVLEGPGGLIDEAFSIGAEIRQRGFATMVGAGTECYSACALIWLAGTRKYTSGDALIGVHAAYTRDAEGVASISGAGNAEVGAYLNMVGLRIEAIRYITTADPDEFLPLTPNIARRLGIEIHEQDGFDTTTPRDAPSAPRIAYETAELLRFDGACGGLFGTNGEAESAGQAHLRSGHDAYGGATFATLVPEAVDAVKSDVAQFGELGWCVQTSETLLSKGFEIGIDGPSYNCAYASHANEHLICDTPSLWGLDLTLDAVFSDASSRRSGDELSALKAGQARWLRTRMACGSDVRCTAEIYYSRIGELLR